MRYCLRTKPGRLDLPLDKRTLSLSCSDKICVFNVLGIQGKMLFNYIVPIYINKIIV
jgi:tRNA-specific adenosine deaminase 1